MTISFALSASGELGGLAVSKGGNEANFNVTLKWQREGKAGDDKGDKKED
jgi:hypothetical protein